MGSAALSSRRRREARERPCGHECRTPGYEGATHDYGSDGTGRGDQHAGPRSVSGRAHAHKKTEDVRERGPRHERHAPQKDRTRALA